MSKYYFLFTNDGSDPIVKAGPFLDEKRVELALREELKTNGELLADDGNETAHMAIVTYNPRSEKKFNLEIVSWTNGYMDALRKSIRRH